MRPKQATFFRTTFSLQHILFSAKKNVFREANKNRTPCNRGIIKTRTWVKTLENALMNDL